MTSANWIENAVAKLNELPAMPAVARQLLKLDLNTDAGEKEFLALIARDPQITAKIIGVANSASLGFSKCVTSTNDAATVIGLTRAKAIAVSIAALESFPSRSNGAINIQQLWAHSLVVAFFMRVIANHIPRQDRPPEDSIFLAGLLHDLGFVALNHIAPEVCSELLRRMAATPDKTVEEIEADMRLTLGHAEIGATLARRWGLPPEIIEAIGSHHELSHPTGEASTVGRRLAVLINLSERLMPADAMKERAGAEVLASEWTRLGINQEKADEVFRAVSMQDALG